MTPSLATLLARIGWSVPELARRIGRTSQQVYGWHAGRNSRGNPSRPPADVLARLQRIAEAIEREMAQ